MDTFLPLGVKIEFPYKYVRVLQYFLRMPSSDDKFMISNTTVQYTVYNLANILNYVNSDKNNLI